MAKMRNKLPSPSRGEAGRRLAAARGEVPPAIMRIARTVAREEMLAGARAVLLTGSFATGTAHERSDIDLIVVYSARPRAADSSVDYGLAVRSGRLVSINRRTVAACRQRLLDPQRVGSHVPGFRDAIILADADGIGGRLQWRARAWRWDEIAARADAWVAAELTGFAEEIHKLVAALERGQAYTAAVQRSVIALGLAPRMAVHHRILYGSENVLWDLVAARMGSGWAAAQSAAFGAGGEDIDASSRAALRLYALATAAAAALFDARQRRVVAAAVAAAKPSPASG